MKLHMICKYTGLLTGGTGAIMILIGIITYFTGELFGVSNFSTWFWFAQPFFLFGIFGMVVYIACKDDKKE